MRSTVTQFVLPLALLSGSAIAQGGVERSEEIRTVQDLERAVEAAVLRIDDVRLMLEMTTTVSGPGGEELQLGSKATIQVLRKGEDMHARMDVDMRTPAGPMRIETWRGPDGIKVHYAGELRGESWLSYDKELMLRLEKASRVLGSQGPLQRSSEDPRAFLGKGLIAGLARNYEVVLGKSALLDGVDCHRLVFTLRKQDGLPLLAERGRPTRIDLLFGTGDHLLRRMIQLQGDKVAFELKFLTLKSPAGLSVDKLTLAAPEGVEFQDVRRDPLAGEMIRSTLAQLDAWEKAQEQKARDAKDGETKDGDAKDGADPGKGGAAEGADGRRLR